MTALQKYQYLNRKPHFDFFKDRVQINQIKILREYKKKHIVFPRILSVETILF